MSDVGAQPPLRVALVAEGPTDAVVVEAALKALLPRAFVLTQLQPEPTRPKLGAGWGGVLRWCLDFAKRGHGTFEADPLLPGFDLFVVHVDADVAELSYADLGVDLEARALAQKWPPLPTRLSCPPPAGAADAVRACALAWAGLGTTGAKTVLCVPSKATEAWLVAAVFEHAHPLRIGLECALNLEKRLSVLSKTERIKKTRREYLDHQGTVTANWGLVRTACTQADRFSTDVSEVMSA